MAIKNQLKKGEPLKLQSVVVVLVGQPDSGKTSLACTADRVLFFDVDDGLTRAVGDVIPDEPVQPKSLQDFFDLDANDFKEYKTIVIDTIGKFIRLIELHINTETPQLARDGRKYHPEIKRLFDQFNMKMKSLGVDVVYTAQVNETEKGDVAKIDIDMGSKKGRSELIQDAHLIGYVDFKDKKKRRLCFDADGFVIGKNSPNIPEQIVDVEKNPKQLADIIAQVKEMVTIKNKIRAEKKEIFEDRLQKIENMLDLETVNFYLQDTEMMADIAIKSKFAQKAKELGFIYNKETKLFENSIIQESGKEDEQK